jgi:hypothetical protein
MTIHRVDVSQGLAQHWLRAVSYGSMDTGKTFFGGGWPRPLFLSVRSENGETTLATMPREVRYELDRAPEVWTVGDPGEMTEAVDEAAAIIKSDPGRFMTIVTDSLSLYADEALHDNFRSQIQSMKEKPGVRAPRADGRMAYGDTEQTVTYIVGLLHDLPVHVLHLCLADDPVPELSLKGGPLLPGKQLKKKIPARAGLVIYHEVQKGARGREFVLHTQTFGHYHARSRYGDLLPEVLPEPRYRYIETALALGRPSAAPVEEARPAAAPTRRIMRAPAAPQND